MAANPQITAPTGGAHAETQSLPLDGFTRWNDLKRFIPLSHESVRLRELAGRFPKRVQLGSARSVGWPNREIHRWLSDPAGYRA
ncbi:helix-turn-helix transcriptional regulator [Burkholderia cepacia]|jgi:prophage regulatory protein|uniref:helix-turn-helix transcriptional regulator n=1 Tax=Burkholderia cepacia TaxID=292 RepID=UPI001CF2483D|nr:AlpA family phage regulatory protein [Burkholderia cepacia]MCA8080867.1 AlpA family transcriptional regulator [Burkholderia cepacia]